LCTSFHTVTRKLSVFVRFRAPLHEQGRAVSTMLPRLQLVNMTGSDVRDGRSGEGRTGGVDKYHPGHATKKNDFVLDSKNLRWVIEAPTVHFRRTA
jgi:hypothetical protein